MKKFFYGYFCGGLSAVVYGLNPFFGIPLYRENMSVACVLFYRFAIATILLGIFMLAARRSFVLPKKTRKVMILEGVLLAATCLFWFLSFRTMSSGLAATILYTYPAMIAAALAIFFREKISSAALAGIALSFAGVALICSGDTAVSVSGVVCALLSALTYAAYIIVARKSALNKIPSETMTFYAMLIGDAVFFLMLRNGADLQSIPSASAAWNLLGLAFFTALLSFLLLAVAVKHVGETPTAILGALEPVTAVIIGIAVFNEPTSLRILGGILLVLAAVTLVLAAGHPQKTTAP